MKHARYADVYNAAFEHRKSIGPFFRSTIQRFRSAPRRMSHLPRHHDVMVLTQHVVTDALARGDICLTDLHHAMRLVHFIRKRAASLIARHALHMIYRPTGPWLRRELLEHRASALSGERAPADADAGSAAAGLGD